MNIEDLTKTQLLLLTLLVNFVTSIATGVLTVSLLDQAPATVIQTVNRIVDHTIDTVTTEVPVVGNAPAAVPSTEDLLTNAIAENSARAVSLYRSGTNTAVAAGFYLPSLGVVFTVSDQLPDTIDVMFKDGTKVSARQVSEGNGVKRYGVAAGAPTIADAKLIPAANLKPGQTVIALGADGGAVTGIVSRVDAAGVVTDLPPIPAGGAVVNLSGDVVGISSGTNVLVATDAFPAPVTP